MLDLEVVVAPTHDGLSIVSLEEFKRHLRINYSKSGTDADLTSCIVDAAAELHYPDGELNRCLFPTTFKRYMSRFPKSGPILMPFPPLIEVTSVNIEDGESPPTRVDPSSYVVRTGTIVGEIEMKAGRRWPAVTAGPRAVSVTFRAGYQTYPPQLKRMVKFLAAHYFEAREASITDHRVTSVSRKVQFAMGDLRAALRVPVSYDDWSE